MQIPVMDKVEAIHKAVKGWGTNEAVLIASLAKCDPVQINAIRTQYDQRFQEELLKRLKSETSGKFEEVLLAVASGPLLNDVNALKAAMKGMGTDEAVLNHILVGRSNADMNAIKTTYQKVHGRSLDQDLKSDLSAATETLFLMLTAARRNEDSVPVVPQQIDQDVRDLNDAFGNMLTKNSEKACQILTSRNDAQIRAIAQQYEAQYRQPFSKVLEKTFSGHMEKALLLLLARAQDKAMSDADQMESAMAGMGTKNTLLIQAVVSAHWNRQHMQNVCQAYKKKYGRSLVDRISGETSGDYKKMLVAMVS